MQRIETTVFPELTTERLTLRQLRDSDAMAIARLRSDEAVNRYIDRPKEVGTDAALAFISKINESLRNGKCFYWAVCLKGDAELIGTVCVFNFPEDKTVAELGYELSPDYQRKGIANEAVKRVIDFAFNTAGLGALEACVHHQNHSSVNLLLKNDFVPETDKREEKYPDYVFFMLRPA